MSSSPIAQSAGPSSTMKDILEAFPGAQRTLFRRYHIGGCSSCAFQLTETLEELCRRNNNLDPREVLEQIRAGHEEDVRIWITPPALEKLRRDDPSIPLIDVRSKEEFDAVHIAGSRLLSQPVMQEILSTWPRERVFVIVDHRGAQALDAAAYFHGHGFSGVRCLQGGVDAWAQEIETDLPRYRLA